MTGEPHRVLREQIGAYALGQLSGDRWRAVHTHLGICAACRGDLDEIAPVAALLGTTRERLRPDELTGAGPGPVVSELSEALLAQVRAAAPGEDRSGRWARARARARVNAPARRWLPAAAAAIAVIAAGGIGFAAGASSPVPAGPVQETVAVRALDPAVQAEAVLVAHTWGTEVMLTATGFQAGTPFRVTVTDDAGRTVSAGEFIGTGDAEMSCNLNSSILRADASSFQVAGPAGEVVLEAVV